MERQLLVSRLATSSDSLPVRPGQSRGCCGQCTHEVHDGTSNTLQAIHCRQGAGAWAPPTPIQPTKVSGTAHTIAADATGSCCCWPPLCCCIQAIQVHCLKLNILLKGILPVCRRSRRQHSSPGDGTTG
jgi:hypothetical protein